MVVNSNPVTAGCLTHGIFRRSGSSPGESSGEPGTRAQMQNESGSTRIFKGHRV